MAKDSGEPHIAEQCLCNAGIAKGNSIMDQKQKIIKTFYKHGQEEFKEGAMFGGIHNEMWSDEESEEEAQEAEYGEDAPRMQSDDSF